LGWEIRLTTFYHANWINIVNLIVQVLEFDGVTY